MQRVYIHQSGDGADAMRVVSHGNGTAYSIHFGCAGTPMRDLFFEGDDATQLRAEFDNLETRFPDELTRDLWLRVLDPHL